MTRSAGVERTGSPWRDLPERYGPWKTAHQRFTRWAADGTWARMKAEVLALAELDDDIDCRSLATLVTPGQAADTRQLIPLLELVRVPRPNGIGRPRSRPESVTGDQAYSSRSHRQARRGKRIRTTIPEPNDQIADRQRRGSRGGRPPAFDPAAYRHRNQVDRGFNLGVDYQATLDLVEMLDRLRAVPGRHDPRERT